MADTVSSSNSLNVGLEYLDENAKTKTITLKVPNPKANITESQIKNAMNNFVSSGFLLDPLGNAFSSSSVATASTVTEQKIQLDVGWNG